MEARSYLFWNDRNLQAEALKYNTLGAFMLLSPHAFGIVVKRGLVAKFCTHMLPVEPTKVEPATEPVTAKRPVSRKDHDQIEAQIRKFAASCRLGPLHGSSSAGHFGSRFPEGLQGRSSRGLVLYV